MDIGFVWDETKYEKVKLDHDLVFAEVVEVLEDINALELADPGGKPERFATIGRTRDGRVLIVVCSDEDLPLYRVITGFDADEARQKMYYERL